MGNDNNNAPDVFLWSRSTNQSVALTRTVVGTVPRAPGSIQPWISDDGRYVTFTSDCSNLAGPNETNVYNDVFLYDHTDGSVLQLSVGNGTPRPPG